MNDVSERDPRKMVKSANFALLAVSLGFVLSPALKASFGASAILGVQEGDWVRYTVESGWFSTFPETLPPSYLQDINNTDWLMRVEDLVDDETVIISIAFTYVNGSEALDVYVGNVRSGSGNVSEAPMWIVRKSLEHNDRIFSEKVIRVNSTVTRTFAGAARTAAYANFTQFETSDTQGTYQAFWDSETGVLCSELVTLTYYSDEFIPTSRGFIRFNIAETNLWERETAGPDITGALVVSLVVIVTVLGVGIALRSRARQKKPPRGRRST